MSDNFIEFEGSEWGNGVAVDEYKGTISLVAARKGNDGKVYMDWCYPQKGTFEERKPHTVSVPWKISIGTDKQSAIIMLGRLGKIIEDMEKDPFA
jgi:hypothetical protein